MQRGFYFDQSRCTGCHACAIACRDWHDIDDSVVSWRRVVGLERGAYPGVEVSYISLSCTHCEQPACMAVCPVGAIRKRPDGEMAVDREACLGGDACGACRSACPFGIPQFGNTPNPKMQMCTLCPDRLAEGRKPVCVDACPMRALDCGPMDELRKKYGDCSEVRGFVRSESTRPAIIFKPRYPG
jgi:anaerobic dimethyl sulfoxide reductase subunit B